MGENEVYIYPKSAKQKLKLARENNQTVYLYGKTGYGKVLWLPIIFQDGK